MIKIGDASGSSYSESEKFNYLTHTSSATVSGTCYQLCVNKNTHFLSGTRHEAKSVRMSCTSLGPELTPEGAAASAVKRRLPASSHRSVLRWQPTGPDARVLPSNCSVRLFWIAGVVCHFFSLPVTLLLRRCESGRLRSISFVVSFLYHMWSWVTKLLVLFAWSYAVDVTNGST